MRAGEATIEGMIDGFAKGNAAAVCLHPRPRLLKPYGGHAWFEFIRHVVDRVRRGIWSVALRRGSLPQRQRRRLITLEHPEYRAMEIGYSPEPAKSARACTAFPLAACCGAAW